MNMQMPVKGNCAFKKFCIHVINFVTKCYRLLALVAVTRVLLMVNFVHFLTVESSDKFAI